MALPLSIARSGLARVGDVRAGYPIQLGEVSPLYALSGGARSGAIRSNYHSSKVFITIGGTHYGTGRATDAYKILDGSFSITDVLDEQPNTARFTTHGFLPTYGQEVIATLGSKNNAVREFAGQILSVNQSYEGSPSNYRCDVACIDYTWGLNKRKVIGQYTGSASTIVTSLISTYCSGYTTEWVQTGLDTLTGGITFTDEEVTDALTRIAKRIGAHWYVDYYKRLHFFVGTEAASVGVTQPTDVTTVHLSLRNMRSRRDLSQVVTRCYVEGAGPSVLETIAAGETIIPVASTDLLSSATTFKCGAQRLTATSLDAGGGGSLVGPGASPSAAPAAALASGAGCTDGAHQVAVSFVTGSGESLAGPTATVTTGVMSPPSAPTAGTPTIGTGPDPGTHLYALSYVNSAGETLAGSTVSVATTTTTAPATAPTVGTPTIGTPGPDPGTHEYAVSFVTSIGETTPGPIGAPAATTTTPAPSWAPSAAVAGGAGVTAGSHDYAVTFVTSVGETTQGPVSGAVTTTDAVAGGGVNNGGAFATTGGSLTPSSIYIYTSGYVTAIGETVPATYLSFVLTASDNACNVTYTPSTDPRVTGIRIYRRRNGGAYERIATIGNSGSSYLDTASDASIAGNPAPPVTDTTGTATVNVTGIPTGGADVTSRKLYRRSGGAGFKLLATLANNTATTYTDTTANASLGAAVPSTNTAYLQRFPLTAIPKGDSNVTSRKIYRRSGGAGLKLVTTIGDNTTTTCTDTVPNASLGAAAPTSSTAYLQRFPLTAIPKGDSNVIARNIYRRSGGAGLKLATTIGDNTTTTWTDTVPNASLGAAAPTSSTAYLQRFPLSWSAVTNPLVTNIKVYGTAAGGSQLKLITTLASSATSHTVVTTDAALGANAPGSNTATANQIALTGVPIGAATVTSRKVYMTAAGGTQLKLVATIANNTATTYTITTADGSLGANAPSVDASGLAQPAGVVLAGSTSILVAGTGWANSTSGGWAIVGNGALIRYTGVTSSSLTGIPASGVGSIAASISYNATISAAPCLRGVPSSGAGSVLYTINKGDQLNLLVQVDDTSAQTALAALIGGDGIQEAAITDQRLSKTMATAIGTAVLEQRADPLVTIEYEVRDINTRAGSTVAVNLGAPTSLTGDFKIQQVTISGYTPSLNPIYAVQASSARYSFEDLLRMVRTA